MGQRQIDVLRPTRGGATAGPRIVPTERRGWVLAATLGLAVVTGACRTGGLPPLDAAEVERLASPRDYPEANVVFLDDEVRVRFSRDRSTGRAVADVTTHFRARILAAAGAPVANIRVGYSPSFGRLMDFRARTLTTGGTVHNYTRADAADTMATPSFMLYSDSRLLTLSAQPDVPGTMVEWTATLRYDEPRLLQVPQQFGGPGPTHLASLEVIAPTGWKVEHRAARAGEPISFAPSVSERDGLRTLTWQRHNVPAAVGEIQSSAQGELLDRVSVRLDSWDENGHPESAFASARALSAWMAERSAPSAAPTPELTELATRIVDGAQSPEERARRLYAWVRDQVAYCAVEIGMGGLIPHPARDVERLRYGDCKDKATLLHTLLAAVGVRSRQSSIYAHDGLARAFGMPTISRNFNHEILRLDLDSGPHFLDPTARTASFDVLPLEDEGADTLPLEPGGAELLRTPMASAEKHHLSAGLSLVVDEGGQAHGTFRLEGSGGPARELRSHLLSATPEQQRKVAEGALDLRRATVEKVEIAELEPGEREHPITLIGTLRVSGVTGRGTDVVVVRPAEILDAWLRALPDRKRVTPVVWKGRRSLSQLVRFQLPPGAQPSRLPEPVEIAGRFLSYALRWERSEGGLTLSRALRIDEPRVPPADYPELRKTVRAIIDAEAAVAVVHLGAAAPRAVQPPEPPGPPVDRRPAGPPLASPGPPPARTLEARGNGFREAP